MHEWREHKRCERQKEKPDSASWPNPVANSVGFSLPRLATKFFFHV